MFGLYPSTSSMDVKPLNSPVETITTANGTVLTVATPHFDKYGSHFIRVSELHYDGSAFAHTMISRWKIISSD